MNKSIFTYIAEAIERYRADRRAAPAAAPQSPSRLRRDAAWAGVIRAAR